MVPPSLHLHLLRRDGPLASRPTWRATARFIVRDKWQQARAARAVSCACPPQHPSMARGRAPAEPEGPSSRAAAEGLRLEGQRLLAHFEHVDGGWQLLWRLHIEAAQVRLNRRHHHVPVVGADAREGHTEAQDLESVALQV
eukprot:scaffold4267_cov124-Isochrysis_galbana.AAC.4